MHPLRTQLLIIAAVVVAADVLTKQLALAFLPPTGMPMEVVGDWLRFTLAFNRGAAFGMHVGPWSRLVFSAFAIGMVAVLLVSAGRMHGPALRMVSAMGLVAGGAVGNLIDRIRWERGVVDFIDVGVGMTRFWTFNVADSAITIGAVLLLWPMPEPASTAMPADAPSGSVGPGTS